MFHRMKNWLHEIRGLDLIPVSLWLDVLCTVACFFGAIAQPVLVIAAMFDTSHYPAIHQTAADTFFCLSTISLLSFMSFMRILSDLYPDNKHLALSGRIKAVVFVIFLLAFLVYIPIGIAITCPARLLGIKECEEVEHLSSNYCESYAHPDMDGYTILWTYKDCPVRFTMRTVAQFTCIFSLLAFSATFAFDLRPTLMYVNPEENTPPPPAERHQFLKSVAFMANP
ncbi:hypothetical protein JKP88DRAFT_300166 [Tribonema minus]|uniref:CWH43-like N-terminal domain-containing protein n=1 Tax=Tribonema minus TaxID=303371 RepID=A0A836CKI8_9STRA|nr:hypothetical protein JKP88DRAFT_300166 [Tribonema minus]